MKRLFDPEPNKKNEFHEFELLVQDRNSRVETRVKPHSATKNTPSASPFFSLKDAFFFSPVSSPKETKHTQTHIFPLFTKEIEVASATTGNHNHKWDNLQPKCHALLVATSSTTKKFRGRVTQREAGCDHKGRCTDARRLS
jgi:hypothetical protein